MSNTNRAPIALVNSPPEVGPGDGPEVLLASCIPDLELNGCVFYPDLLRTKFDADGGIHEGLELLLSKLEHQAGLANVAVSYDDVFKKICVVTHLLI